MPSLAFAATCTTAWPIKLGFGVDGTAGGALVTEETGTHWSCRIDEDLTAGNFYVELPGLDCLRDQYQFRITLLDKDGNVTPMRSEPSCEVQCVPRTGFDFDGNGSVNAHDYQRWIRAFQTGAKSPRPPAVAATRNCEQQP